MVIYNLVFLNYPSLVQKFRAEISKLVTTMKMRCVNNYSIHMISHGNQI